LTALVVIPALLLLVTEVILRLAGFGYPTSFFLESKIEERAAYVDNPDFGRRFFPPGLVRYPRSQVVPADKAPETVRIIVLGESAAMGDPDPKFGLPRMLEVLLSDRFPGRQIEVVNVSMVAINSHAVLPIARECAGLRGDLWVVFMGNNEMIGPFGSLSVFGAQTPPWPLIRAGLALKRTRLGQGLAAIMYALRSGRQETSEWGGMTMMAHQKIAADDPRTLRVYRHFQRNLAGILDAGQRAGIPILLCSVATNLKDCPPFASLHREDMSDGDMARWRVRYEQGVAFEEAGDLAAARVAYQSAAEIDDHYADLLFRWARSSLEPGQTEPAAQRFRQARDRDALQFRTDSQLNQLIQRAAAERADRKVRFFDAEAWFAAHSPHGVPGSEFFLEHVHLSPEGNYLLAQAMAEQIVDALDLAPAPGRHSGSVQAAAPAADPPWLSLDECLRALGFTEWNRHDLLSRILERVEQPPFTQQIDHAKQIQDLRQQIEALRAATKPALVQRAAQQVARAVAQSPNDTDLRWNLAQLLDLAGDAVGAEEQWRAVIRLHPHAHLPYYNLAKVVEAQGRDDEARQLYLQCLERKPDYDLARQQLAAARNAN
jgi:tetratricopeptide (TPR) repeat protein